MRFYFGLSLILMAGVSLSACAPKVKSAKRQALEKKMLTQLNKRTYSMVSRSYPKLGPLTVQILDLHQRDGRRVHLVSIWKKNGKAFPYISGQAKQNRAITLGKEVPRATLCRKTGISGFSSAFNQFKLVPDKTVSVRVTCK